MTLPPIDAEDQEPIAGRPTEPGTMFIEPLVNLPLGFLPMLAPGAAEGA